MDVAHGLGAVSLEKAHFVLSCSHVGFSAEHAGDSWAAAGHDGLEATFRLADVYPAGGIAMINSTRHFISAFTLDTVHNGHF